MGTLFEGFRQDEKKARQPAETAGEIKGPSVKEILADKKQSDLFGEYLKQEGDEELGEKILAGKLRREEYDALSGRRKGFLEIIERSTNVLAAVDRKSLQEMAAASPDLKKVADVHGTEGIEKALRSQLPRMAIMDREHFEALSTEIVARAELKKAVDEEEGWIRKMFKKYGDNINENELREVLRGGDATKIAEEVRKDMSWWQKRKNSIEDIKKEIEGIGEVAGEALRKHSDQLDANIQMLGGLLEASLMENEDMRAALGDHLKGEMVERPEPGMSFAEAKTEPDDKDVRKEWREYQKLHMDELAGDLDYNEALHDFSQEYTAKKGVGKKGFWATIWAKFFSSSIENMLKK